MQSTSIQSPATGKLIFLCFLVAVFEGVDIQAMGVAAPALAAAFRLTPAQMGEVMSASTVGLMLGAAAGGWLSDRIGRARVIMIAMAVLSVFSFATVAAPGYASLRIIRVLAGLGLGGAFPNLIAIVAEHSPSSNRTASLAWMYIGLPVGGAAAGLVASWTTAGDWRPVFYVGGLGPLLLVPLLLAGLPPATPQDGALREPGNRGRRGWHSAAALGSCRNGAPLGQLFLHAARSLSSAQLAAFPDDGGRIFTPSSDTLLNHPQWRCRPRESRPRRADG